MSVWTIVALGVIVALVGFIMLQRRKPTEADKVAAEPDTVSKGVIATVKGWFAKKP